jgi:hypothetical protein
VGPFRPFWGALFGEMHLIASLDRHLSVFFCGNVFLDKRLMAGVRVAMMTLVT